MPVHIDRNTRLEQDYKDLKSFCEQNDSRIRIIGMDKNRPPEWYDIVVDVKSIVRVRDFNHYSESPVYGDSFSFHIELNDYYPSEPPIITTIKGDSLTPFHPHFEVHYDGIFSVLERFKKEPKSWAKWVAPLRYNSITDTLDIYLRQMIRSLQYHDGFLATIVEYQYGKGVGNVANEDAGRFYNRSDIFPTDDFLLEPMDKSSIESINEPVDQIPKHQYKVPSKKFDIQVPPKKFNINNNSNKKKSFVVQEQSVSIDIPEWSINHFLSRYDIDEEYNANFEREANQSYRLFFTESARKKVWKHIGFGNDTFFNKVEQGGIMLGLIFKDSDEHIVFVIVKDIIKAREATGTPIALEMNHQVWQQMMSEYDEYIRCSREIDLRIVGWYHTHPNHLNVFMSPTDRNTQSTFFKEAWQFAVVLNPHRKIWKVFQGKDSRECLGFCLQSIPLEINPSNGDDTLLLNMHDVNIDNNNE